MTARELLDEILSQGPHSDALALECRLIFRFLGDNLYRIRLANGGLLRDMGDMRSFCEELVRELAPGAKPPIPAGPRLMLRQERIEQPRDWNDSAKAPEDCPICHHQHENKKQCSKWIGQGRFCQCTFEVTA